MQSVDVIKYTDEEYEKYLTDPVCINLRLQLLFLIVVANWYSSFGLTEIIW